MKFKCRSAISLKTIEITTTNGVEGVWRDWKTNNKFINGVKTRYHKYDDDKSDNTCLQGISF